MSGISARWLANRGGIDGDVKLGVCPYLCGHDDGGFVAPALVKAVHGERASRGVNDPVGRDAGVLVGQSLGAEIDRTGGRREDFHHEDGCGGEPVALQLVDSRYEQVGLEDRASGDLIVDRREDRFKFAGDRRGQQGVEPGDGALVGDARCGGHEKASLDKFVAMPVIGKAGQVVGGQRSAGQDNCHRHHGTRCVGIAHKASRLSAPLKQAAHDGVCRLRSTSAGLRVPTDANTTRAAVVLGRYYDPTTAQFLTVDPLDALTQSAYGSVADNPLNGTDPSGLMYVTGAAAWSGSDEGALGPCSSLRPWLCDAPQPGPIVCSQPGQFCALGASPGSSVTTATCPLQDQVAAPVPAAHRRSVVGDVAHAAGDVAHAVGAAVTRGGDGVTKIGVALGGFAPFSLPWELTALWVQCIQRRGISRQLKAIGAMGFTALGAAIALSPFTPAIAGVLAIGAVGL
jgi:hypothetical protein